MITISPIEFYSLCPHHLALIFGKAYVGYIPKNRVLGLSKVPRLVRWLGGTLIKQEDLTAQIARELEEALDIRDTVEIEGGSFNPVTKMIPRSNGVAVVLKAVHTCMTVRGVRVNQDCKTITSSMTGCFLDPNKQARSEFLALVNNH
jgi:GTP cyclohydrolase I